MQRRKTAMGASSGGAIAPFRPVTLKCVAGLGGPFMRHRQRHRSVPSLVQNATRRAFSLVELLVTISIIATLVGMLLPAVQSAREAARRMSCVNNQKQIGTALHLYHDANNRFPQGAGYTQESNGCPPRTGRYVWTFKIMPFLELGNVAALINPGSWNGGGPNQGGDSKTLEAFQTPIPAFQCPSDFHTLVNQTITFTWVNHTQSNYVACFSPHGFQVEPEANETCLILQALNGGQRTTANPTVISESPFQTLPGRSLFNFFGVRRSLKDVTDGTSQTVAVSEVIAGDASKPNNTDHRGLWWLDQGAGYSHWMTPNSPEPDRIGECPGVTDFVSTKPGHRGFVTGPGGWGAWMFAARSAHPGVVVALFADGSVRAVSDYVASSVWTALGSMNGGEQASHE